ncbi:helix-turn-helix transcriptional regulator [Micromonospora robiginosa]|uniref:AraC family transcriptional regulator n=1 Tax=Micromonospora robiginosa TaxID=2749844 RepID=A0A7L6B381_9ACTN|nr:AraC family transcriptional regulator [Micromonospora ferruginea]QLQ36356.1 AraC family transcriptional regulator [Micromonospora ferruginea]
MTDSPPVWRTELSTRDPDVAREAIAGVCGEHRPRFRGNRRDFRFAMRVVRAGPLAVHRAAHTMDAWTESGPHSNFMAVHLVRGRFRFVDRERELLVPAGGVGRYPLRRSVLHWVDVVGTVIQVPLEQVARTADRQVEAPPHGFRFLGLAPVSPAMSDAWAHLSTFLHRLSVLPDAGLDQPLMRASLTDLIASTALAVFPNTTMTASYVPEPRRVAPSVVRRAQAYLEEHAAEPITVAQVAAACGVGPRGLQAAFQRHLGHSPLAYLRQVRLARAHRDLVAVDPARGATVAGIARRWGWSSPGRFAVAYREAYGEHPSETLRK